MRKLRHVGLLVLLAVVSLSSVAHAQAVLSAGFENAFDLADAGLPVPIALVPGKTAADLVGMGVGPDDTGYYWWSDGTVSLGSAVSTYEYGAPRPYLAATGQQARNIVGMAVDYTNDVYTYYLDGTVSIGTAYDLDAINSDVPYTLPRGYIPGDIVGAALMDEDIMLFMRDGTFHISDISDYDTFTNAATSYQMERYAVPAGWTGNHILGLDFADTNGQVFTIYSTNRRVVQAPTAVRRRILDRDRTRRRRVTRLRDPQPQPPQVQQQDGVNIGPNGITLRKDGWSFTLPTAPK